MITAKEKNQNDYTYDYTKLHLRQKDKRLKIHIYEGPPLLVFGHS